MTRCIFAVPGALSTPAGSYAYAREVLPHLARAIRTELCTLPASFPLPAPEDLEETGKLLGENDRPGTVFLIDSLAFGAMPPSLLASIKSPIAALLHHPLGLEEGLLPSQKDRLLHSEQEALGFAKNVIVCSPGTAREISTLFGVTAEKIVIALPGIFRGARATGAPAGEPLHIVSVGSLTPRKGFPLLVDALASVRDLPWRATIAGSPELSPETAADIYERVSRHGLGDRIRFAGQLSQDALSALYTSGDLFALATYYEGYGMVLAEAMAHGLPVVTSGEGAVAETVPAAAGYVCQAGDVAEFASALRAIMSDPALRAAKANAAWTHGQTLPSWPDTAAIIADAIQHPGSHGCAAI